MRKHLVKGNNRLKRILAVCVVMVLLFGLVAPAFASEASETDISEETQEYTTEDTDSQLVAEENIEEQSETREEQVEAAEQEEISIEEVIPEEEFVSGPGEEDDSSENDQDISDQEIEVTDGSNESGETEEFDSATVQSELDAQITALMSLDDANEITVQDVTQNFKDLYPQYETYDGEMEGVSVEKAWTGDAEYNRPESVTFDLYLNDQVIDSLTLTAADDWKGSFANHYPAYKLNSDGTYALDDNGEKIPLNYQVKEREVANYKAAYSQESHRTTVDSSSAHLFVPATELQPGEQYIVISSSQPGQQKLYRAEAYQTDKILSSQVTISDKKIKDKDGNIYDNYILMNDGDGSYEGLLWNAFDAGNNSCYMFSNVYELWGQCHGLIQMSSTQNKMTCPHVNEPGEETDVNTQAFYKDSSNSAGNAYKTASSSECLYFYKEVTLPDGAFNSWQTEAFVSNRYDPPITVDPDTPAASEKVDMGITKEWENDSESDRPESITIHLYADGEDTGKTLALNKNNNWSDSFKDLDVYKGGKRISYSVSEDVPEGYKVSYRYDNTDSSGTRSTGKGYWVRTDKLVDGETYLIVTSPGTGSVVGMEIDSNGKNFNWTSGKAGTINVEGPITINGQTYGTHITQEEAEKHTQMQWTAHYQGASSAEQVGYHNWFLLESVSNSGCYPKFNGTGDISDGSAHESLLYYGLQWKKSDKGGQNGYVAMDENGNEQTRTPTVENYPDDFSYVFGAKNDYFLLTSQQTGDANAKTAQTFYLYRFVTVSGPSATITNTKQDEKTSLAVYKAWRDDNNKNNKRPESITVELLKNRKSTGKTQILNEVNGWSCTFEDLPKFDERGEEIQYSAKETDVPDGYTCSYITGTTGGTEENYTYSYAWVPVTSMQAGKEYILAAGTGGSQTTIGVSGSKATLSGTAVNVQNDRTLTDVDGNHYSSYITEEDAAKVTRWTAEISGSYVILKNGTKYLQKGSGDLKDSSQATKLIYDDSNHALKTSSGKYMASNGDFNKSSPDMTTYLYERVQIKDTITVDTTQFVTNITNTYHKLINMPETGSNSRIIVTLLGIGLLTGGSLLMINNKKRGVIRGTEGKD